MPVALALDAVSDAVVEVDEVDDADDEDTFLFDTFLLLPFAEEEFEHSRSNLFTFAFADVECVLRAKIASIENELHLIGLMDKSFTQEGEKSCVTLSSIHSILLTSPSGRLARE